jgi:hypothetical protein
MSDAAKFTYNLMIKMQTTEAFSYFPAMEEGGTGEFSDESDDEDKSDTVETECDNTPIISSITEARKNSPLAAWQPFIPSNWQENSSQSSPAQPCWPFSYSPLCSSTRPPATTN